MAGPIHFLAISAPSRGVLCGLEGAAVELADLTVMVQRVTCPGCLDRLNRQLAMLRNRAELGFQGGDDKAAGMRRLDTD